MEMVEDSKEIDRKLEDIRMSVQADDQGRDVRVEDPHYRQMIETKFAAFEPKLREFLRAFQRISRLNEQWRKLVFQGVDFNEPDEDGDTIDMDFVARALFGLWLQLSDTIRQRVEYFQRHQCQFKGNPTLDIRLYAEEAKKVLNSWRPPARSTSIALRFATIPEATAEKVRAILADKAKHSGRG